MQYVFVTLVFLFFGENAHAWAPATHLFFVKEVLHYGHLLNPGIRELISAHLSDFFYGCIAADITIGKAYVEYLYNCHNFDVGLGLLKHARKDKERAFVYGYLSHLAADTVSHNFFVPYQNVEHFELATFRHAYWEVRFDQYFLGSVKNEMNEIVRNPDTREHDKLLDGALKDTIFSFKTNRVLFGGMMAVQRLRKWQQFVSSVHNIAKTQFNPHYLAEYNRLATSAIILFFNEETKSPVYRADPTGKTTIEDAKRVRAMLRSMKRRKSLTKQDHQDECEAFRQRVRELYFKDYKIEDKAFQPSIHMKI